jgi:endonuclease YncB( thermonuclease family)
VIRAILLLLFIAHFHCFGATRFNGIAISILDGDTIRVESSDRVVYQVRLAGIDAPEKGQPFGEDSRRNLSRILLGKLVVVQSYKTDRYGRLVGKVFLDGSDISLMQIRAGLAWHYKQYQKEQSELDRDAYSVEESTARQRGVGLWSQVDPVPPWVHRKGGKAG